MPNWIRNLIITGIALAAVSVVVSRWFDGRQSAWETRVEAVSATARANLARALEAEAEADSLRSQAAEIAAGADARAPLTDSLIITLPAPRTPADSARDVVIGRLVAERDMYRTAYQTEVEAAAKLQEALDLALERGDSLQTVLDDRPGGRPWFIPRLTLGPSLGTEDGAIDIDPLRVNLGWEIKL